MLQPCIMSANVVFVHALVSFADLHAYKADFSSLFPCLQDSSMKRRVYVEICSPNV